MRVAETGHRDIVGAGRVKIVDVGQEVGGGDDLCGGIERTHMADKLFVVGAFQQGIGDAQDDDLRLANAGMEQRIHIADIAVNHVQAAIRQRPEYIRIKIDDADLIEQQRVLPLDLAQ